MGTSQERQGRGRLCFTWLDLECHLGPLPVWMMWTRTNVRKVGNSWNKAIPFQWRLHRLTHRLSQPQSTCLPPSLLEEDINILYALV